MDMTLHLKCTDIISILSVVNKDQNEISSKRYNQTELLSDSQTSTIHSYQTSYSASQITPYN